MKDAKFTSLITFIHIKHLFNIHNCTYICINLHYEGLGGWAIVRTLEKKSKLFKTFHVNWCCRTSCVICLDRMCHISKTARTHLKLTSN